MMMMTERKAYGEMKRIYLSQHLLNHGNQLMDGYTEIHE